MQLLEREQSLARLRESLDGMVLQGVGSTVLVFGEAGIGKTALVRQFVASAPNSVQVLSAACEALFSPRPLGPLVDLDAAFAPATRRLLAQRHVDNALFPTLLQDLRQQPRPTILLIEDLHWADAATLDFVRYLARRIAGQRTLLILTYRSDELDADHALRLTLGELPPTNTLRIPLAPLSVDAVTILASRTGASGPEVHALTGGNPFYVSEVLSSTTSPLPISIADAVLARMASLSAEARDIAEWVSIFPRQAALETLRNTAGNAVSKIDEAVSRGLLIAQDHHFMFRHELARLAVYQSIAPYRRIAMHQHTFQWLAQLGDSALAQQVHHAEGAGSIADVKRLAPRCARQASARGAYRDAVQLLSLALRYVDDRSNTKAALAERATLLEAQSSACTLIGHLSRAIPLREQAIELRRRLGDQLAIGANLAWISYLYGFSADYTKAQSSAAEAVTLMEQVAPNTRELAMVYGVISHLCLMGEQFDLAVSWGNRAVELADRLGDRTSLCQGLSCVATARLRRADDAEAWVMSERGIEIALQQQRDNAATALCFMMRLPMLLAHRRYAAAIDLAQDGLSFCADHGLDTFATRILIRRAFAYLQLGQWQQADADLKELQAHPHQTPAEVAIRDLVRSLLDLRRGQPNAPQRVLQQIVAMRSAQTKTWFTSAAAARAECAWLTGETDGVPAALTRALDNAKRSGDRWRISELMAWQKRLGINSDVPPDMSLCYSPYALEIAGDVRGAAFAWRKVDAPYEAAMALSSGDIGEQSEALQLFDALGANAAAARLRQRLRQLSVRGERRSTRRDPLQLTARERSVFELLLLGLPNAQIAARLHRSARTVEHHVAAVFGKLRVHSRTELVAKYAPTSERGPAVEHRSTPEITH